MKFAGKYAKFVPMDGFGTLVASGGPGLSGLPEDGIPLEALPGASMPGQLKQVGQGAVPPSAFGGPPGGPLGGPLGGPMETNIPPTTYVTDIPIKAEYSNIYGTNVNATYNPTTGAVSGGATVPIGAAERGYRFGVEGSYVPGIMDADGITPPPGYSGMIRFSKTNPVNPSVYERPGAEKFNFGLGVDATPRRVPPRVPVPVEFVPPGY